MQIRKSHRILAALLALVMVIGMLPTVAFAKAAGDDGSTEMNEDYAAMNSLKPIGASFNVDTLLEWTPESDPDAMYSRASIPLTQRVTGFSVNELANPEAKLQLWSMANTDHDNASAQGSDNFFSYAFNYWQYTNSFVYWSGSEEGFIVLPTGEYVDAAHTNGVPVVATLGFPWGSGYVQQVRDFLQKDAEGNFPVADKMIELMDYYGFDGYAFNQESYGCSAEDGKNIDEMMRYLHTKRPEMLIVWYDSMLPSGGVSYQNAVTGANKSFMEDSEDGTRAIDEFLMNYNWYESQVNTTISTMKSVGRSQFDAFAGFNVQANVYGDRLRDYLLVDADGVTQLSLGLYYANQTITLAKSGEEFHETEQAYYVNAAGDPRVNEVDVSDSKVTEWAGMSRFFADKTPVLSAPFVTNFNTGHGRNLFVNGELSREGDWSYQSNQDVLPTWTWIIDCEGEKLEGGYDFTDAYNGGSSVKFSGSLAANTPNDIMLYSTKVEVTDGMSLSYTYKGDQGKMKLVLYYGDENTTSYEDCTRHWIGPSSGLDCWTTEQYDLSDEAGKILYAIGLQIESDEDIADYQVNLGQITILDQEREALSAPNGLKLAELLYTDCYTAEARINWKPMEGAASYEIYQVYSDGSKSLLMETPNTAYYLPALTREAGETDVKLEVVAVNYNGVRGDGAELVIDWAYADGDTDLVVPDNSVNVCLNVEVTGYSEQGDGAECDKALDGTCENASKWWASGAGDWMSIDLGRECAIQRWVIMHGGAGGEGVGMNHRSISLYYKNDAGEWIEADRFDNNYADITDILLEEPITAREWKIRINQIGSSPWGAVNIYEWQMFETGYPQTDAIPMQDASAINGVGAADSVTLKNVPNGHTVRVYKEVDGEYVEIGSKVSTGGDVTVSDLDFGTAEAGKVFYTTNADLWLESARLCVFFDAENAEKSQKADNVRFVRYSHQNSDSYINGEDAYASLTVKDLQPGDKIYVYENGADAVFTKVSLPVASGKTSVTIDRVRVPANGGELTLQVKRAGCLVSDLYQVAVPAELPLPSEEPAVVVTPSEVTLNTGDSQQFTASYDGEETGSGVGTDFTRAFHLDAARKYFSADTIKSILDTMESTGMNQLELYVSDNQGFRFALDDMKLTTEYGEYDLTPCLGDGYVDGVKKPDGTGKYLTQSEMDDIIAYANAKGIDVVGAVNVPGHMGAILEEFPQLRFTGSKSSIDLSNEEAKAFAKAFVEKYAAYFASKGCTTFSFGADEYANDVNGMGFAAIYKSGVYKSDFVPFFNEIAKIIEDKGMTPRAFNDGVCYNHDTTVEMDTNVEVCYWSAGWNGYNLATAPELDAQGFKLINTSQSNYWVMGDPGFQVSPEAAEKFNYTVFTGGTYVEAPEGAMLCVWCDDASADGQDNGANVANNVLPKLLAAFGRALDRDVSAEKPLNPEDSVSLGAKVLGYSGQVATETAAMAVDGKDSTKWCVEKATGWMAIDLGEERDVSTWLVKNCGFAGEPADWNTAKFALEVLKNPDASASDLSSSSYLGNKANWTEVQYVDNTIENENVVTRTLEEPVTGRYFRLRIDQACVVPPSWGSAIRVHEFQLYEAIETEEPDAVEFDWTVEGAESIDTYIDETGLLTVGEDETAKTLTVKAALASDAETFGTAVVNVISLKHAVTVDSAIVNGLVKVNKTEAKAGEIVSVTVLADEGYQLAAGSLKANGVTISGGKFVMPDEDVVVTAVFEAIPQLYNIIVLGVQNGTVTASKNAAYPGEIITLTVTPDKGYRLVEGSLMAAGKPVEGNSFVMGVGITVVTAKFERIPAAHSITVGTISNGTVTADKTEALAGETVTLTVEADEGYALVEGSLKVNGVAIDGTTFVMPAEDVTVTAEFEIVTSITGIVITPDDAVVRPGGSQQFTAVVTGTGNVPQDVKWYVDDCDDWDNTWVDENGMLYVSENETADTILVGAWYPDHFEIYTEVEVTIDHSTVEPTDPIDPDLSEELEALKEAAEAAQKAAEEARAAAEAARDEALKAQEAAEEAAGSAAADKEAAEKAAADAIEAQKKAEEAQSAAEEAQAAAEAAQEAAEAADAIATLKAAEAAKSASDAAKSASDAAADAAGAAQAQAAAQAAQEAAEAAQAKAETAQKDAEEAAKRAEEAAANADTNSEEALRAAREAQAAREAAEAAQKAAEDAQAAAENSKNAADASNKEAAAAAALAAKYAQEVAETYAEIVKIKADMVDSLAEAVLAAAEAKKAALAAAKVYALTELAAVDTSDMNDEQIAAVKEVVAAATEAINASTDREEVKALLTDALAQIQEIRNLRCAAEEFSDVSLNDWFHEDADFMLNNGYMNGYPGGTFRPDVKVSRAQLVTILYRVAGEPEVEGAADFSDVAEDYYTNAVIWAAEQGITTGYPDGTFRPNAEVSRQELVTFLYRFAEAEAVEEDHLTQFPDAGRVANYAVEAMNWAIANGIVSGAVRDNVLVIAPEDTARRDETCAIVARYMNAN